MQEFDNRIIPNTSAMKSLTGQIAVKENSRKIRINDYINKFKLILEKTKAQMEEKPKINPKTNSPPKLFHSPTITDFHKKNSNNMFHSHISNKANFDNGEFGLPYQILLKMNENTPEIEVGSFNVKDTLYPDLKNAAYSRKFKNILKRLNTVAYKPKEPYPDPRKSFQRKDAKHEKAKSQIDLYTSMNMSTNYELEIPFINVKVNPSQSPQLHSAILRNNSSMRATSPQIFAKKTYFPTESSKVYYSGSTRVNTAAKKVSTASSVEYSINNPSFVKGIEKEKKKLLTDILKEKAFGFANYKFPATSMEFESSQFSSLRNFL